MRYCTRGTLCLGDECESCAPPDLDDLDDLVDYANPDCQCCNGRGYVAAPSAFEPCPVCIVAVWS